MPLGIDRLQLVDQAEHLVQPLGHAARLFGADGDAGETRDALDLVGGQGHGARLIEAKCGKSPALRLPEVRLRVS